MDLFSRKVGIWFETDHKILEIEKAKVETAAQSTSKREISREQVPIIK